MSNATPDRENNTLNAIEAYFLLHVVSEQKIGGAHTVLARISHRWTMDRPLMGDQCEVVIRQLQIVESAVTEIETLYSGLLPLTLWSSRWPLLTLLRRLSTHAHEIILESLVYKQQETYHASISGMERKEHMYKTYHKIIAELEDALKAGSAWRDDTMQRHINFSK